jgi:hypothetical protein
MVDSVDWMKVSLIRSIPSLPMMMGRGQFSVRDFEAIGWRAPGGVANVNYLARLLIAFGWLASVDGDRG